VLIAAERRAQPVSELLREIRSVTGSTALVISAISVIELCHGLWRADTPQRAEQRRLYLEEIFSAVPVQPFIREMGELAAKLDAEARKGSVTIPFADLQIGVTALHLGYEIVTGNVRHFQMINGLVVRSL
jgi:predicted nucleic acid-binding protein